MNTLFSSKILLSFFLFFFVSLDCILCADKMLYQDGLENYSQLPLPGVVGPESIAFDCNGEGPYVSVSDGRILKWKGAKLGWIEFSVSPPQRQDINSLTLARAHMHACAVHFALYLPFYVYQYFICRKSSDSVSDSSSSHKSPKTCTKMITNRTSRPGRYSNSLQEPGLNLASLSNHPPSPRMRDRHVCDDSTNTELEPVCGRPLGIKFNPATCDLYIADAYYGLLVVGPEGGVATQLAASAEGVPFRFTNALDIDSKTGVVYFTDSSIYFQRREYLLAIITADKTGRLMKYDPKSKKVTVLLKGLAFPNGVAVSKDSSFILVAESFTMRILKFYLVGSEIHGQETFIQLGRFPDNIKRTANGEFWVALNTGRGKIRRLDSTEQQETATDWFVDDPVAVRLTSGGKVVRVLDGNGGNALDSVSEVEDYSGLLWIGSSIKPYVGYIKNKK
ncbi:hypothetical protein SADUNF_Sadunf08G0088800 [Salix dunnii]|uniref:Strictosidine synthase conserved region domain-containing protein n=1 Tax=Salix dunnii TaxID=1413687 RepID=A0A835MUK0_9ROSI|nr:hypothetical protein SADUNF_Sadunf08G0088800 [Salix dunnii]